MRRFYAAEDGTLIEVTGNTRGAGCFGGEDKKDFDRNSAAVPDSIKSVHGQPEPVFSRLICLSGGCSRVVEPLLLRRSASQSSRGAAQPGMS